MNFYQSWRLLFMNKWIIHHFSRYCFFSYYFLGGLIINVLENNLDRPVTKKPTTYVMDFLLQRKRDYFVIPKRGKYAIIKIHKPLCDFAFLFFLTNQNKFCLFHKTKNPRLTSWVLFCGERGIRTPGGVTLNSFQDCRIRPLCHFSYAVANIHSLFEIRKVFLKNDMPIFTLSIIYGNHYTIRPSTFSGN